MGNLQPHIRFSEEEAAKYAILPGDPKRVDRIAKFLDDVNEITFNREYKSVSGYPNRKLRCFKKRHQTW